MPTLPPRACNTPLCSSYQSKNGKGHCDKHQVHRTKYIPSALKKERDRFYDRVKWRNARHGVLMMEPLCRMCIELGIASEAKVVDHILRRSHEGDEYCPTNLMPLCKSCHDRKTRDEQKFYDEDTHNTSANHYLRFLTPN